MSFLSADKTKWLVPFLNTLPDSAFIFFDLNLQCLFAGGGALRYCGLREAASPFSSEDEALCREALGGKPSETQRVIQFQIFKIQAQPVRDESGEVQGGVLFFQNITAFCKESEELRQRNRSLKEALSQLEEDKQGLKKQIAANIQNILLPMLEKMKLSEASPSAAYVELIEKNLKNLTNSFGLKISERFYRLTPKEIQICVMIKNGLSSREIGRLLNISEGTIESHRNHIRRKLDIAGKNVNLSAYLQSFDGF